MTAAMNGKPDLQAALVEWARCLGDAGVQSDAGTRASYGRTTLTHGAQPGAVLLPTTSEQVQEIVRIAARHGVPLYPISRGRNWGYGDRTAPSDGQVIVDLGRLNRIIEVNGPLAYAVIEPGVTQGQLFAYLKEHHPNLWMDSTGAGPDASIIGNTVDRGFGHTPVGDHFHNTCGLEVVLASGEVLRTGFGHFAKTQAAHVYPYGIGPILDGLFTQSNLGIVTRAGVWLMPAPEAFSAFFVSVPHKEDLPDLIDRLTPLRLSGLLRSGIHIANDLRVISARMKYPWNLTGGSTPIPENVRSKLADQLGVGAWNVSGGIYGLGTSTLFHGANQVEIIKSAVQRSLRGYRVIFLSDFRLRLAKQATSVMNKVGIGRKFSEVLKIVEPAYGLLKGIPSDEFLRGVLWQSRKDTASLDPLDHNVGLIWVSPIAPATGAHAQTIIDIAEPIYRKHGFDFLITFTIITERSLACVTNLTFDKGDPAQCARAAACYDELMETLLSRGYPPYRTGPSGYAKLRSEGDVFWETCSQIKAALDPGNIMAPGRYVEEMKSEERSEKNEG
jgi:4-cresol dehydrogenase (hydroxylating)